ncbi:MULTISPECIES: hypothetical protein [unclassified Pseudomonas]|uniref:hypothetical protein n=1 Tax=unclassified Pseudomonas TaxID=196821 RepID=UPI0012E383AA|nr:MULTISPECIES: hypothetical protein [unclassified Pseudomonas]
MIYLVQAYARRTSQPSANKLSTSPPTAIGDNCGKTANFLHKIQRKIVTYPEACFHGRTDHFLIDNLKATYYKAFRGWQTPYPQKRQQTLGLTSKTLWKTAITRNKPAFTCNSTAHNRQLIIF